MWLPLWDASDAIVGEVVAGESSHCLTGRGLLSLACRIGIESERRAHPFSEPGFASSYPPSWVPTGPSTTRLPSGVVMMGFPSMPSSTVSPLARHIESWEEPAMLLRPQVVWASENLPLRPSAPLQGTHGVRVPVAITLSSLFAMLSTSFHPAMNDSTVTP